MKAFLKNQFILFQELNILDQGQKIISWTLSLLIASYVLILLAIPLYQTSAHKGIIFPIDHDGGRAIETSIDTRWYNTNHFAPYGNFYYRLTHTLADLIPASTDEDYTKLEKKEFAHNFSLKIISLFSVFGFGLFLGWVLFGMTPTMIFFATSALVLSTHVPLWSRWIFWPHPEHLLLLTTALAVYSFTRYLQDTSDRKAFIVSALMWGLAMAVKRSTSVFLPGCFLLLLFPWKKENIKTALSYIGYMLLSYLAIGFPQNFGFYRPIKFLLYESSLQSMGDLESIFSNLQIIANQLMLIVPFVFVSVFFSKRRESTLSIKPFIVVGIALIPILMRKMSYMADHHTMPLAIAIFILILFIFLRFVPFRVPKFANLSFVVLSLIFMKFAGIGEAYTFHKADQLRCKSELIQILDLINDLSDNKKIFQEPMYPANERISLYSTQQWGLDWGKVNEDIYFLGINTESYKDYSDKPPRHFYGKMIEEWDIKSQFYSDLKNKDVVTSPNGLTFKKIFSGECNFELWKRNE